MDKKEIKQGIENLEVYTPVKQIEQAIGMPNTTIQQVLTGSRSLPAKWVKPLRKYFLENRDKDLPVSQAPKVKVKDLTKPNVEVKPKVQPKSNYSVDTRKPKTLAELKALCPAHLKGFEKSEWISTERVKYGI